MSTERKIALITGGSRGLGKNMALRIAEKGLDVIITYKTHKEAAYQVVKEIQSLGQEADALQLDASKTATLDGFVALLLESLKVNFEEEAIDFLINNAGIGLKSPQGHTEEKVFDELMNVHLKSVFFISQKLIPYMKNGGGIINISTGLTRFAIPGYSLYASMKGAIEVLSRYQAVELGSRGIRSNVVAPGPIETDFEGGAVRDNKEINQFISQSNALERAGLPEDVGGVVAFLCTEDAKWINAQRIEVSGGQNL
ncbi:SDR family NAD(P)-dependent oxidoreductase [Echinicola shivajiensis]|uniref:SDR family NAD(P)-dependent oxidoreductase n=1 Tax=Echinicola shivajiensis TaxID=1035916 RepID=UPI001BFC7068|nr:SDR family oxidoreductase [Echinicola shivajiensis]